MTGIFTGATPAADWVIVLPLVLALFGAALLTMLRRASILAGGIAVLVIAAIIACEIALVSRILAEGPVSMTMGKWLPPFGISFTADLFGAGFALAASIVTLVLLVYDVAERDPREARDGFYAMALLLLAGVTGAFLTGDLFNLYVWFEVMLIASFGLIVLGGGAGQLDGAIKYGFLNFLATAFFLLALGLLYGLLGTLNMADIMRVAPGANPAPMAGIAALLLLAFSMKAAAFPLNAWLPASYHMPPAAISALFGGLLTKVGAYALLRTLAALLPQSRDWLDPLLTGMAVATLLIAPLGAIAETNLRRAIGFMLIGGIGAILAGLAMPTTDGIAGAGFYIFHAMLTLTALYLVAGLVEKLTGETDTRRMGGLYAANSGTSILFLLLVLAVSGVPPFLGFWPKLLLLQTGLDGGDTLLVVALILNAFLTLIAGSRLWAHVFWRAGPEGVYSEQGMANMRVLSRREAGFGFGAAAALALVIFVIGLWPNPLFAAARIGAGDLLDPARYVAAVGLAGGVP